MANNDKTQGVENGLIVKSIGTAIAIDAKKEKKSSIIIAYAVGEGTSDIRFTAIRLPKKQLYGTDDFLSAICKAEKVKNITYCDFDGTDKDIYVCRNKDGNVYDYVERDHKTNKYGVGFAEIETSTLKFETNVTEIEDTETVLDIKVTHNIAAAEADPASLQYAVVNAYNACLLGIMFSHEEFQLETGEGKRVKIEVRSTPSRYIDLSTLYVKPEIIEGDKFVNTYVTEPINVINGRDMSTRVYRLAYRKSQESYYIAKCD